MLDNQLKGGKIYLAHSFRNVSASWQGGCGRAKHFTSWWIRSKERNRKGPVVIYPQGPAASGLLSPSKLYPLKFPESPETAPPAGDLDFNI
jgi:hypothetical protein